MQDQRGKEVKEIIPFFASKHKKIKKKSMKGNRMWGSTKLHILLPSKFGYNEWGWPCFYFKILSFIILHHILC